MSQYDSRINHLKEKKKIREKIPIWVRIKEKVKIPDLIQLENNRCECLQSGNPTTNNPSCRYYNTDETLHCHKCQKTMDVIQVYAIINNLEHSEAIKSLAKQYNIPFGKVDREYIKKEKETHDLFQDFMIKCNTNPEFQNKYAPIEMKKRGFTKKTIERFKIGLFDDSIKSYMIATYSKELLLNAGFINRKGNWSFNKRIVYPYLDQNNNPKYFIYRLIDSEPDFNKNAKYVKQYKTKYVKEIPFGLNSLNLNKDKVIITEGITDAISVIKSGYPCLSPVTTRIKKKDIDKMISYCKRFEKVIVINDNELSQEGLKGAKDILKTLTPHKINAYISIIPNPEDLDKIDLNDYLKTNGEKKLNNLINDSIKGLEFFIEELRDYEYKTVDIKEILELISEDDVVKKKRIFSKIKNATELNLKDIEDIFNQILNERKELEKIEIDSEPEEETTEEQEIKISEALKINVYHFLESEDKFELIKKTLDFEIVGEEQNKVLMFILLSGAYFDLPSIILIIGESSGGKTFIVDKVIKIFPDIDFFKITGASDRAIHHREWREYMLVISEVQRSIEMIESLKDFGDDGIHYIVSERDPTTGNWITIEINIGRISIVATTVKEDINSELMNRAWRLEPDIKLEHMKKVVDHGFGRTEDMITNIKNEEIEKRGINVIQNSIPFIKKEYNYDKIEIPYIRVLESIIDYRFKRIMRDKDKLINLIKRITAWNYRIREYYEFNNKKILLSHPNDLITAMKYGHAIFRYVSRNLTPEKEIIIDTILDMPANKEKDKDKKKTTEKKNTISTIVDITTDKAKNKDKKKERWFTTGKILEKVKKKLEYTKNVQTFRNLLNALCGDAYLIKKKEGRNNMYKIEEGFEPLIKEFDIETKFAEAIEKYEERRDFLNNSEEIIFHEKNIKF